MPIRPIISIQGDKEIAEMLAKLPNNAGGYLHNTLRKIGRDMRERVASASRFKTFTKGSVRHLIHVNPKNAASGPMKLKDVVADVSTYWMGPYAQSKADAAAVRVESTLGSATVRPLRHRYLFIPARAGLGAKGMRSAMKSLGGGKSRKMTPRDYKNAVAIPNKTHTGFRIVVPIKNIRSKARRGHERSAISHGGKEWVTVGFLVRSARNTRPLHFFDGFNQTEPLLKAALEKMLEKIASGRWNP